MSRLLALVLVLAIPLSMVCTSHYTSLLSVGALWSAPLTNETWRVPQLRYAVVVWIYNPVNCSNCLVRTWIGEPFASWIARNGSYRIFIDNSVDVTNESFVSYLGSELLVEAPINSSPSDPLHYIVLYYGTNSSVGRAVARFEVPIDVSTGSRANATIAVPIAVPNFCTSSDCRDLGFVENGEPLSYWLVRVDRNSAIAIVKLNVSMGVARVLAVYNSSLGSLNTTSFIPFLDTFEVWSGWTQYGSGVVSQSPATAFQGRYSLLKNSYSDPNGGYKALPFTVSSGCVVLYAWINRSAFTSANYDRVGFIDANGNGYGIGVAVQSGQIVIDRRSSYSGTLVAQASFQGIADMYRKWYLARFAVCLGSEARLYASVANTNNTQLLGYVSYIDNSPVTTSLTRVYVFGGYPYYVDALMVIPEDPVAVNATARISGVEPKGYGIMGSYVFVPPVTPTVTTTTSVTVTTTSVTTSISSTTITNTKVTTPPMLLQSLDIKTVAIGTIVASLSLIVIGYFLRRISISRY